MANPWEKYGTAPAAPAKPWEKYGSKSPQRGATLEQLTERPRTQEDMKPQSPKQAARVDAPDLILRSDAAAEDRRVRSPQPPRMLRATPQQREKYRDGVWVEDPLSPNGRRYIGAPREASTPVRDAIRDATGYFAPEGGAGLANVIAGGANLTGQFGVTAATNPAQAGSEALQGTAIGLELANEAVNPLYHAYKAGQGYRASRDAYAAGDDAEGAYQAALAGKRILDGAFVSMPGVGLVPATKAARPGSYAYALQQQAPTIAAPDSIPPSPEPVAATAVPATTGRRSRGRANAADPPPVINAEAVQAGGNLPAVARANEPQIRQPAWFQQATAEERALDLVLKRMARDGLTIDDLERVHRQLKNMGGDYVETLGEMGGQNLRGLAVALGQVSGEAQAEIVKTIQSNAAKLPQRMRKQAVMATGQYADEVQGTLDEVKAAASRDAEPAYTAAYETPVNPEIFAARLDPVLKSDVGQQGLQSARRLLAIEQRLKSSEAAAGNAAAGVRAQQAQDAIASIEAYADGRGLPTTMALDFTKRALDDVIESAGQGSATANSVRQVKRHIAETTGAATGGRYTEALGIWEDGKRFDEAFQIGLKVLDQPSRVTAQIMREGIMGRALSGREIDAVAMGVAARIDDLIEAGDNAALTRLAKEKAIANLAAAFGDQRTAQRFQNSMRRLINNRQFGRQVNPSSDLSPTQPRAQAVRDATAGEEDEVTRLLDQIEQSGGVPNLMDTVKGAALRRLVGPAREAWRRFRHSGIYDEDINRALAPIFGTPMTNKPFGELVERLRARAGQLPPSGAPAPVRPRGDGGRFVSPARRPSGGPPEQNGMFGFGKKKPPEPTRPPEPEVQQPARSASGQRLDEFTPEEESAHFREMNALDELSPDAPDIQAAWRQYFVLRKDPQIAALAERFADAKHDPRLFEAMYNDVLVNLEPEILRAVVEAPHPQMSREGALLSARKLHAASELTGAKVRAMHGRGAASILPNGLIANPTAQGAAVGAFSGSASGGMTDWNQDGKIDWQDSVAGGLGGAAVGAGLGAGVSRNGLAKGAGLAPEKAGFEGSGSLLAARRLERYNLPIQTLTGNVVEMPVLKNPSKSDLQALFASAPYGDVRALKSPDGAWYAWPANEAMHVDIANALDLPFKTRQQVQAASFLYNAKDIPDGSRWRSMDDLFSAMSDPSAPALKSGGGSVSANSLPPPDQATFGFGFNKERAQAAFERVRSTWDDDAAFRETLESLQKLSEAELRAVYRTAVGREPRKGGKTNILQALKDIRLTRVRSARAHGYFQHTEVKSAAPGAGNVRTERIPSPPPPAPAPMVSDTPFVDPMQLLRQAAPDRNGISIAEEVAMLRNALHDDDGFRQAFAQIAGRSRDDLRRIHKDLFGRDASGRTTSDVLNEIQGLRLTRVRSAKPKLSIETNLSKGEAKEWAEAAAKGLDMSKEAREARARARGFDVDRPVLRGDFEDIEAFDLDKLRSERAVMFTDSADDAAEFGDKVNKFLVPANMPIVRWRDYDADPIYTPEVMSRILDEAYSSGAKGVHIRGVQNFEGGKTSTTTVVFDPRNIRSVNAAFDPDNAGSANLLASPPELGGAAVGAGVGATNDLDGDGKITARDMAIGAGIVGLSVAGARNRTQIGNGLRSAARVASTPLRAVEMFDTYARGNANPAIRLPYRAVGPTLAYAAAGGTTGAAGAAGVAAMQAEDGGRGRAAWNAAPGGFAEGAKVGAAIGSGRGLLDAASKAPAAASAAGKMLARAGGLMVGGADGYRSAKQDPWTVQPEIEAGIEGYRLSDEAMFDAYFDPSTSAAERARITKALGPEFLAYLQEEDLQ